MKDIKVSEANNSQDPRKCYKKGLKKIQGLFNCDMCSKENVDRNIAFNIAHRSLGYISKLGVTVNLPGTFPSIA